MLGKKNYQNIAVLIDADHNDSAAVNKILKELEKRGNVAVKIAFGDWHELDWKDLVRAHSIKTEQFFPLTDLKNAADIGLVITALRLLDRGIYDAFALIASDSDYTPLVVELRAAGVDVLGYVKEFSSAHALKAYKSAFTEYNLIKGKKPKAEAKAGEKKIEKSEKPTAPAEQKPATKPAQAEKKSAPKPAKPAAAPKAAPKQSAPKAQPAKKAAAKPKAKTEPETPKKQLLKAEKTQIRKLLRAGLDKAFLEREKNEKGFVKISDVGKELIELVQREAGIPEFDYHMIDCATLFGFVKQYPARYETDNDQGTTFYKCKTKEGEK